MLAVVADGVGQHERQHHIAEVLVGHFAHHSAHRLHDVYVGTFGLQKAQGVQRGHIHAFGETFGVGEDADFAVLTGAVQPVEVARPLVGSHAAVYMAHGDGRQVLGRGFLACVLCHDAVQVGGEDGEHCGKSFAVDNAVGIDDGFVEGIPACSVVRVASERVVEADHLRHYAFGEELGVFLV